MRIREILQLPNMLSLSRILLTPLVGYYLSKNTLQATHITALLLILAGITDGLDGFFARRLKQTSELGRILDPLADKIMAGVLVVLLIAYRNFPIWLAGLIIGRDMLILIAGLLLLGGRKVVVPSNLTGKYAFTAIAFLIGSYLYRFPFGILLTTWLTVLLVIISTILYARVFGYVRQGKTPPRFHDTRVLKMLRGSGLVLFLLVYFYKFFEFLS